MIKVTAVEQVSSQVKVDKVIQGHLNALQTMVVVVSHNMILWIASQVYDLKFCFVIIFILLLCKFNLCSWGM